jgi:hypothetical protein
VHPRDGQSVEDKRLLAEVVDDVLALWEPFHQKWCRRADHFYALYRNYQDFKAALTSSTSARGKDAVITDGQGEFGPELFIPMCFSTVETIIPAMLASPPPMDVKPRTPFAEPNVKNVKAQLEAQQEQSKLPLKLQTTAKDGLITGTGAGKTFWRRDFRKRKRLVNSAQPGGGLIEQDYLLVNFDDPDYEPVDPWDLINDPFASRLEHADGIFHRTWRSTRYVQQKIETRQWRNLDGLDTTGIDALAEGKKYDEVMERRRRAEEQVTGSNDTSTTTKGKRAAIHEVLEYHDGDRVVTILDRQVVVASGVNPNWHGELPFQLYRPTEIPHKLHGIGEIEPIEKLQEELNTLRTQRRYNADLVLQRVFAYHEGLVERDQIAFGPGYAIGVNGDPRELLQQLQVGDIPNSGYEEEDRLNADFDRTSGISDVIAGAAAGSDTATGVQLMSSAASRRIENKLLRLELEVINPASAQFIELSQQRVLYNRDVRVPARPTPEEPDRRWAWFPIGPQELMGEFEVRCLSGSTAPENIPQNRSDAQMASTLLGTNPAVDQRKVAEFVVEKLGAEDPEAWLTPPTPMVPAAVLDRLSEAGVPQQLIVGALAQAGGPNLVGGEAPPPGMPQGEGEAAPEGQPGEGPQEPSAPPPPPEPETTESSEPAESK